MINFTPNTLGLKVLTPSGYQNFSGIAYMGDSAIYRIEFSNKKFLECTEDHTLVTPHGMLPVNHLKVGDFVYKDDRKKIKIKNIKNTGKVEPVYDLIEVENGHKYVTNSIISSNCAFITDDDTLINPFVLNRLKAKKPEFYILHSRWYQMPLVNKTYLVGLDPSLGSENDYAAIQVFMLPEMIQIAEWQENKSDPRAQVRMLMRMLVFLDDTLRDDPHQNGDPEIYWTIENNTIGEATLQVIEDTGEDRFPGMFISERKKKGQTRRFRKGFNTSNQKKLSSGGRLKTLLETGRMTINSHPLIRELKNYVHKGASFGAKSGENDDLIAATLLVIRMLDVVLKWTPNVGELPDYITDDEVYENEPFPISI